MKCHHCGCAWKPVGSTCCHGRYLAPNPHVKLWLENQARIARGFDFEAWVISSSPSQDISADCPVCGYWAGVSGEVRGYDWPTVGQLRAEAEEHWNEKHRVVVEGEQTTWTHVKHESAVLLWAGDDDG